MREIRRSIRRIVYLIFGLWLGAIGVAHAGPIPDTALAVSGSRVPGGIFASWNFGFDMFVLNLAPDAGVILLEERIKLTGFDPGLAMMTVWEEGIEQAWGGQYKICASLLCYDILVDAQFTSLTPHHVVTVHAGTGNADIDNWYMDMPSGWPNSFQGLIAAHEFGHLLGSFDEYALGPLNPLNPIIAINALMADLGPVQARYYDVVFGAVQSLTAENLSIVPFGALPGLNSAPGATHVPEPATVLLFGAGTVGLVGIRVWRGRCAGAHKKI